MRKIDQFSIRKQNIEKIWNVLVKERQASRQTLAQETGLSLMTVTNLVDLFNAQQVLQSVTAPTKRVAGHSSAGRKAELLSVRNDTHAWLVLDLTSEHFRMCLLSLDGSLRHADDTYAYDPEQAYAENLAVFLRQVRNGIGTQLDGRILLGIGVITPGPYHADTDTVFNKRIPALNAVALRETLRREIGDYTYVIEEDVKLAIRAYLPQAMRNDIDLMYYIYLGEGVGGAIAHHGEVLRGLNAVTGDAGQAVYEKRRTYEEALSLRAFAAGLLEGPLECLSEEQILERLEVAAAENPEAYRKAFDGILVILAELLVNLFWVIDPEMVVIDCRYAAPMAEWFLQQLKAATQARLPADFTQAAQLISAYPKTHSATLGAIQALTREWFELIV